MTLGSGQSQISPNAFASLDKYSTSNIFLASENNTLMQTLLKSYFGMNVLLNLQITGNETVISKTLGYNKFQANDINPTQDEGPVKKVSPGFLL